MSTPEEGLMEFLVFPSTSQSVEQDETESFKWGHNSTLLFLDLYQEYRQQVGSLKIKNFKRMFEEIAKELKNKTGRNITGANCENRWKHLERMYKKYIENNNKTGRGRRDFEYAEVMERILGKKKNVHPSLLLSSESVVHLTSGEENAHSVGREQIELEQLVIPSTSKVPLTTKTEETLSSKASVKTHRNKKLRVDVLREMREDRKNFYKKMLEIEEKKLLEKQRTNCILEERNNLLKQHLFKECPVVHLEESDLV